MNFCKELILAHVCQTSMIRRFRVPDCPSHPPNGKRLHDFLLSADMALSHWEHWILRPTWRVLFIGLGNLFS
jgi:hypothetical protein